MPAILGKKLGMTNIFTADGNSVPVTVVEAGPCPIVDIKTKTRDGYEALKLGFGARKDKHTNKPQAGFFKKINLTPSKILKEFRNFNVADFKVGDVITTELFKEGERVKVAAKSKGKGFQGVIKRHNFGGVGGTTHGQSDRLRAPGSIGASSYPSRVFPGTRMAGRLGYTHVTIPNLKIVKIVPEKNLIMLNGAVPGAINTIVEIIK